MKLPVLGVEYTIIEKAEHLQESDSVDGECCFTTKRIFLRKTTRDKETLSHELCHAVLYESSVYYAIEHQTQEVICQQFAKVFSKLFCLRLR
jgi:Zn-dependent peptidase ImmA (M78 family)